MAETLEELAEEWAKALSEIIQARERRDSDEQAFAE